jgi:flagellar hook-associated protein 2
MAIQMTGLASGMDTNSMVKKIMDVERKPIVTKENQIELIKQKKAEWQQIEEQVKALKNASAVLTNSARFNNKEAKVSDEGIIGASAAANVKSGVYILEEVKLAKPARVTSRESLKLRKGRNSTFVGSRTSIRNPNEKFLDVFFSLVKRTDYDGIEFKVNDVKIPVKAEDTVGTFINKINTSSAGAKAKYDVKRRRITIESVNETAAIKVDCNKRGFTNALGLKKGLGKEIKNAIKPEHFDIMKDVDFFDDVDSGYFSINDFTFNVDKERDSLKTIILKINDSGAGVRAVYDEGTKTVSLVSTIPGKSMKLENDTSGLLKKLGLMGQTPSGRTKLRSVYKGQRASFIMDGVQYQRESNEVEFDGLKITLRGETEPGQRVAVEVAYDTEAAVQEVAQFLNAYNESITLLEDKTKKEALLQGDTTATSLMLRLRKKMTDNVNGVEDKFNQLALIGVTTDEKSGRLTINENKFRAALDENPLEIKKLFTQKKDNTEPIVLGLGNNRRTVYDPKDPLPGEIDEIKVVVGDKEYSTDSNSTPLIRKSELYKYQVSKVDLIKYVIYRDVKTRDEALAKLGN